MFNPSTENENIITTAKLLRCDGPPKLQGSTRRALIRVAGNRPMVTLEELKKNPPLILKNLTTSYKRCSKKDMVEGNP